MDSVTSEKYYQPKRRAEIALLSPEPHLGRAVNWQRFNTRPPGLWNGHSDSMFIEDLIKSMRLSEQRITSGTHWAYPVDSDKRG